MGREMGPGPAGIPPILTHMMDPDRDPNRCAWFLDCENQWQFIVTHPTLGQVPSCESCLKKVGVIK